MLAETTRYLKSTNANRSQEASPHFTLELNPLVDAVQATAQSANRSSRAREEALLKDRMLEIRAASIVCDQPQLHRYREALHFCATEGVLVLTGCIPSYYLKQLVQETLRSLEGVRGIENRIFVA